jgi:hypothetical protein
VTTGPMSQCATCANMRPPSSPDNTTGATRAFCAAFPAGIPDEVRLNRLDHRQTIRGDRGVRWAPLDGEEFPEYAFLPAAIGRGRP